MLNDFEQVVQRRQHVPDAGRPDSSGSGVHVRVQHARGIWHEYFMGQGRPVERDVVAPCYRRFVSRATCGCVGS